MRRFTRLTNGFSKKIGNHVAMVAIDAVYYNFGRIHKTLRITPAMPLGYQITFGRLRRSRCWQTEASMKVGDKIRLVRVPPAVKDDGEFKTRTMLTKCIGRIFTIRGFQGDNCTFANRGSKKRWLELDMREAIPGVTDTIWVEPDCVALLKRSPKKRRRVK